MNEDLDELKLHCKEHDIVHEVFETNIYSLAEEKIRRNSSYCSFFSRMRRGSLYSAAKQHGCNKVALLNSTDATK